MTWLDFGLVTLVMIVDIGVMIASPKNQRIGDLTAETSVIPVK